MTKGFFGLNIHSSHLLEAACAHDGEIVYDNIALGRRYLLGGWATATDCSLWAEPTLFQTGTEHCTSQTITNDLSKFCFLSLRLGSTKGFVPGKFLPGGTAMVPLSWKLRVLFGSSGQKMLKKGLNRVIYQPSREPEQVQMEHKKCYGVPLQQREIKTTNNSI